MAKVAYKKSKATTHKKVVALDYPLMIDLLSCGSRLEFVRVLPTDTHRTQVWFEYKCTVTRPAKLANGSFRDGYGLGKPVLYAENDLSKLRDLRTVVFHY